MYSLNVPVPGEVHAVAMELRSALADVDQLREDLTLVAKRLPVDDPSDFPPVHERTLEALDGAVPFEVRIDGIGTFEEPVTGPAPVIYLAVESPGLMRIHERMIEEFEAIPNFEGDEYVPHITLGRGGDVSRSRLDELRSREVERVSWSVDRLNFWDPRRGVPIGEVRLPV